MLCRWEVNASWGGEVKGRLLFVNKKKQKNFCNLGRAGFSATGPNDRKFLRRFFLKSGHFLPEGPNR
jgi:hypothetical protein